MKNDPLFKLVAAILLVGVVIALVSPQRKTGATPAASVAPTATLGISNHPDLGE